MCADREAQGFSLLFQPSVLTYRNEGAWCYSSGAHRHCFESVERQEGFRFIHLQAQSKKPIARIRAGAPRRSTAAEIVMSTVVEVLIVVVAFASVVLPAAVLVVVLLVSAVVVVVVVAAVVLVVLAVVVVVASLTVTSAATHISSIEPPAPQSARKETAPLAGAVHDSDIVVTFAALSFDVVPVPNVPPLDTSL